MALAILFCLLKCIEAIVAFAVGEASGLFVV